MFVRNEGPMLVAVMKQRKGAQGRPVMRPGKLKLATEGGAQTRAAGYDTRTRPTYCGRLKERTAAARIGEREGREG